MAIRLVLFILGCTVGIIGTMTKYGNDLYNDCRLLEDTLQSEWAKRSREAYYNENPEVAIWALENLLEFYNLRPVLRYKEITMPSQIDLVRTHIMIAISSKKIGNEEKYQKHIQESLDVAASSDIDKLTKLKTEQDLLDYEKRWEDAISKLRKNKKESQ